jgi:lysophospholipase L1-like esterase
MKTSLLLLATLFGLALNNNAQAAEPVSGHETRMVIIGDSTVCNYPAKSKQRGWGMFIQGYFDTNKLQVTNLALSGRSTKTFIKEGHWAAALKLKPDYVLIQFGHNDSHSPNHPEATDAKRRDNFGNDNRSRKRDNGNNGLAENQIGNWRRRVRVAGGQRGNGGGFAR